MKIARITAIPAKHTVPAVGYHLDSGAASLVFTGDTGPNDALWRVVNRIANLKYLIIETAFSNKEREVAAASKHLCPATLAEELEKMRATPEVYITHLKPGEGTIDFADIFTVNDTAGVKHFYVENDQSPAPYLPDITTSFTAVSRLRRYWASATM